MSYPWIEEKIFWSTKGFHLGKGGQINRIRVHIVRDRAGGRLPSVAPKIHFNLVSGGAHPPTSAVGTLRTGKLKEFKSSWRMVDGQDRTHPPAKGLDLELENWKGGSGAVQGILSQWQGSLPNLLGTDGQNPFPLAARNIENFLNLTCLQVWPCSLCASKLKLRI